MAHSVIDQSQSFDLKYMAYTLYCLLSTPALIRLVFFIFVENGCDFFFACVESSKSVLLMFPDAA